MNQAQKIIKYCALAFAVFLIVNIVGLLIFGVSQLGNILGLKTDDVSTSELLYNVEISNNIDILDIDISNSRLEIKEGNEFSINYSNNKIKVMESNSKLAIEDKGFSLFKKADRIVITIPESYQFRNVDIDTGAGTVYIESLNVNEFSMDMGAGKVSIDRLNVRDTSSIEGGAGEFIIRSGNIHNLDLDMGVGKTSLSVSLVGTNTIDAGVGELNIDLLDSLDNYTIYTEKGIGSIKVNGSELNNDSVTGNGVNDLKISGGIGSINISTK